MVSKKARELQAVYGIPSWSESRSIENGVVTLSHSLNGVRPSIGGQARLFAPVVLSARLARCPQPPTRATVTITADAIAAVVAGRCAAEEAITKAIRAARPDVRAISVSLGTIRWTDPKTELRVTFDTPAAVRDALIALSRDRKPRPFRFRLGPAARVTRRKCERDTPILIFLGHQSAS
jgi:hypothetical protein